MGEPQYAPNHTVDPTTGFLESKAYISAFDADRKTAFIRLFVGNGLSLYETCEQMGLSFHTVNKHYQIDATFKAKVDEAKAEYADKLDGVSKRNAMNPKSVIERIFQLKSLFPDKYADYKSIGSTTINVNVGALSDEVGKRSETIDVVDITPVLRDSPTDVSSTKQADGQ